MGKKKTDSSGNVAPSAPPESDDHQQHADSSSAPYPNLSSPDTPVNSTPPPPTYGTNEPMPNNLTGAYIPQSNSLGPQSSNHSNTNQDMPPPPSYSDAVNCPAPPYLPYGAPKPAHMHGPQVGNPIYPPPLSGTGYVLQAPIDSTRGLPQPHVLTTTTIVTAGPNNCIHCYGGEVHNETDLCCLLCLILFAIFTFPSPLLVTRFKGPKNFRVTKRVA